MIKSRWLNTGLLLGIFIVLNQGCSTNNHTEFLPIEENGQTLLPNVDGEKFISDDSDGNTRTKTSKNKTVKWDVIEKSYGKRRNKRVLS